MENDYNDKVSRVLNLYQRFMDGEVINKNIEAERLGVSSRTIQRDIGAIRNFLDEEVGKAVLLIRLYMMKSWTDIVWNRYIR